MCRKSALIHMYAHAVFVQYMLTGRNTYQILDILLPVRFVRLKEYNIYFIY